MEPEVANVNSREGDNSVRKRERKQTLVHRPYHPQEVYLHDATRPITRVPSVGKKTPILLELIIDELASPYNKGAIIWKDESNGIFKVRDENKFVEAWYQWKRKNNNIQGKTKVSYSNILRAIRQSCDIVKTGGYGDQTFQIVQTDKTRKKRHCFVSGAEQASSSDEEGSAGVRPIRRNIQNRRAKRVDYDEIDELWDKDDSFASEAEQTSNGDEEDSSSEEECLCSNAKNCDKCKQCKATAIARQKHAEIFPLVSQALVEYEAKKAAKKAAKAAAKLRRAQQINTESGGIPARGPEGASQLEGVPSGDPQEVGTSMASGDSMQAEAPAKRPRTDGQTRPKSSDCDA